MINQNAFRQPVTRTLIRRTAFLLVAFAWAQAASAQTISWNQDVLGTIDPTDTAGVSAATYWNNSFPENSVTNLFDSTGAGTTLDIVPASPSLFQVANTPQPADGDGTSNRRLLNGYLNAGAAVSPAVSSVELSSIPYSSYDLLVYFSSDVAGRTGAVSVGATSFDFNTVGGPSVAGPNALFAEATGATTTADAANYAVFSGLSGSSQTVTVDIPDFGGIAGFQVVNTGAAVPAPFTWISDQDDQTYSAGANWSGGSSPNPAVASKVVFGAQIDGDVVVNLDVSPTFNQLNFNNTLGEEDVDGDYFLTAVSNQTITLAGAAEVYASARHWLRAEVAGTSGLNATGPGELILDAVNSFSGGLNVDGGSVAVVQDGALPSGNSVGLTNGADLSFWGATNGFFVGTSGAPGVTSQTVTGNVSLAGGSLVTVNDSADVTLSGVISGEGALIMGGADTGGLLTLTGANTFTGEVRTFIDSVVTVSGSGTLGASDGAAANGTILSQEGQLALNNATVGNEYVFLDGTEESAQAKIASQGTSSLAGNVFASAFGAGTKYEVSSTGGTLSLTGTLSAADDLASSRTYVFSGDGDFAVSKISDAAVNGDGVIVGPSTGDNVSVIKQGSGSLTISTATSASNDFWQASTTVEGGTLRVLSNGSGAGELQSASIDVKSGGTLDVTAWQDDAGAPAYNLGVGQTLSGGGTINAGTGRLGIFGDNVVSPGDDGVGTLNVTGRVSIGAATGGALNFDLGDTTTVGGTENDLLAVSGTFSTALTTPGGMALNASFAEHAVAAGGSNYTLITYANSATPSLTGLALNVTDSKGNAITSRTGTNFALNATSTTVQLQVTGNTIGSRTWSGAVNGTWDKGATANWTGGDSRFFDFDNVTFGGAGANQNVTVATTVSPGTMTVNGGSYSFSGDDISAGSVSVSGASTSATFDNTVGGDVTVSGGATLSGAATFQDNVSVQGGSILQVGGAGLAGQAPVRVISYNFDNTGTIGGDGAGSLPPLDALAGVIEVGGWTNDFPDFQNTDLRDDTGAQTTLDIGTFSSNGSFSVGTRPGQDGDGAWNAELLNGYLNSGGGPVVGLDLNQIPFAQYDVYVYFNADVAGREGAVTGTDGGLSAPVSSETFFFSTNADVFNFAQATDTTDDAVDPGANYAVFSGTQSIFNLETQIPDFGGIAGFQVVSTANASLENTTIVEGNVSLAAGSIASFDIGSSGLSDLLDVTGSVEVADGFVLELTLDPGVDALSLLPGDIWNLLNFAEATGEATQGDFLLPTLAAGLAWDTSNLLVDGSIAIGLAGDFNGDGAVDAADYTVWRDNEGSADESLIANAGLSDGLIDSNDYDVWVTNFGTTLADFASSQAAAVPEPAALTMLIATLFTRRRVSRRPPE